jgi:hypothetical protein
MGDRSYSFDANMLVADGAAAMVASGVAQNGGAAGVLDLGGLQTSVPVQQARMDCVLIIMLQSIVTAGATNVYNLTVQGSNSSTFAAGTVQNLASMDFGNTAARAGGAITTPAPLGAGAFGIGPANVMYELMFATEQANVKYQYIRVYVTIAGVGPSIQFMAYVSVLPEP